MIINERRQVCRKSCKNVQKRKKGSQRCCSACVWCDRKSLKKEEVSHEQKRSKRKKTHTHLFLERIFCVLTGSHHVQPLLLFLVEKVRHVNNWNHPSNTSNQKCYSHPQRYGVVLWWECGSNGCCGSACCCCLWFSFALAVRRSVPAITIWGNCCRWRLVGHIDNSGREETNSNHHDNQGTKGHRHQKDT